MPVQEGALEQAALHTRRCPITVGVESTTRRALTSARLEASKGFLHHPGCNGEAVLHAGLGIRGYP